MALFVALGANLASYKTTQNEIRDIHTVQTTLVKQVAANRTTTMAVCAMRDDLQSRADATAKYLKKHPDADEILGVPRDTIEQSLQNQRATLASLAVLDC